MSQTDCMESFAEYHFIKGKIIFCGCNMELPASCFGKRTFSRGDRFLFIPYRRFLKKLFKLRYLAVLCEITGEKKTDDKILYEVKGIHKVVIKTYKKNSAYFEEVLPVMNRKTENISGSLRKKAQEFVFLINTEESEKLIYLMNFSNNFSEFSDFVTNYFILGYNDRFRIFSESDVYKKYLMLHAMLDKLIVKTQKRIIREKKSVG
ncbi:MAG: hypothetical protein KAZ87_05405 [Spirochaetes bacterium]|nr:hypothetical protein [Spirochaetota bacterium]